MKSRPLVSRIVGTVLPIKSKKFALNQAPGPTESANFKFK